MFTADFDYSLPPDRIAQHPTPTRATSRLLALNRQNGSTRLATFPNLLDFLRPHDLLVLNNSKVIPARLRGVKIDGGGRLEILLLEPSDAGGWWVLLRPGKRVRPGSQLRLLPGHPTAPSLEARVMEKNPDGHCRLEFAPGIEVLDFAFRFGEMPLPPYIHRPTTEPEDHHRYQTVYAREPGSAAAPTAGLHFDTQLLGRIRALGVNTAEVTLHVGVGTFAPVKVDHASDHVMHEERYSIPDETADLIRRTRETGGRVIAVGTTSLRTLESVARENQGRVRPGTGRTRLFLYPPSDFLVTDGLLTNFHLPRSTLLMLVAAFASPGRTVGRDWVLAAYRLAIDQGFRFFSYGDAMLLL